MNTLENYIDACVQKMARNEDFSTELQHGLTEFPYAATLYFIRASELAEQQQYTHALHDFATALVLEPEFHLARLQYILCCFKTEQTGMIPVLIQPLLLAGGTFAMIGQLFVNLFSEPVESFEQQLERLREQSDMLPSVWSNLQALRQNLVFVGNETESRELASGEISSILLEIYQQKH